MITINQLELRYLSLCKLRLYLMRKLKEANAKGNTVKYDDLIVRLNRVKHDIALFKNGIQQARSSGK